jgi:hypothetical protein
MLEGNYNLKKQRLNGHAQPVDALDAAEFEAVQLVISIKNCI